MKASKRSVDYSRGHRDAHCGKSFEGDRGYCRHYRADTATQGTCVKVEGRIKAIDWCRLFARVPLQKERSRDAIPAPR